MKFTKLTLTNWRQFVDVDLTFHSRLTVLTGPNGSGKSTFLNLLAVHFETQPTWICVPVILKDGRSRFATGIRKPGGDSDFIVDLPTGEQGSRIGEILYDEVSTACGLYVPSTIQNPYTKTPMFTMAFEEQKAVPGCHINTIRPLPFYTGLSETIPVNRFSVKAMLKQLTDPRVTSDPIALYRLLKRQILSCAPGDLEHDESWKWFGEFRKIVASALPPEIGFLGFTRRYLEIVVNSTNGDFSLDAASQGFKSIVYIYWKIFLTSLRTDTFVVTIDEPELHLHPAMQQQFMNSLLLNFPEAQFIVATHSPFTITATKSSAIYACQFRKDGVTTELLDNTDLKSSTPDDVLKEVLGLPFTMPIWAATQVESILSKYTGELDEVAYKQMISELKQAGFGEFLPESLEIIERKSRDD